MIKTTDLISAANTFGASPPSIPLEDARAIRKAAGVSSSQVAAAVGIDSSTVDRWEAMTSRPRNSMQFDRYQRVLNFIASLISPEGP